MKVLSLFSGIGAFEKALTNIGVDYELVGFSEIDKWAIESYSAIHEVSTDLNLGDVAEIDTDDLPDADMVTYGFPCQDVSVAGLGAGIAEGTRSGLLYEAERVIEHIKPKYAIAENVKNLVGKRFKEDFDELLIRLEGYGYNNYWEVLNAKEFGIPQNRERVFIVSIRKDVDDGTFTFPQGFDSGLRLKDMLLDEVEEKYYIENKKTQELLSKLEPSTESRVVEQRTDEGLRFFKGGNVGTIRTIDSGGDKRVLEPTIVASRGRNPENPSDPTVGSPTQQRLGINEQGTTNTLTTVQKDNWVLESNSKTNKIMNPLKDKTEYGWHFEQQVYDKEGIARTVKAGGGSGNIPKVLVREATTKGYDVATVGDSINVSFPNSKTRRGRVGKEVAQTLETQSTQATLELDYRIRKLTPQETWRLMGFTDEDYWTARRRLEEKFYNGGDRSNSQMYKQAGNSIVVDVLEHLFKNLFKE